MKILVLSDLHLEFDDDGGQAFLNSLDGFAADVLVVAGDLCSGAMLPGVLRVLCERFLSVVYVTGNHEYYGSSPGEVHRLLASAESDLCGFYWLHETEVVINGVHFGGTTLWFPDDPDNNRHAHLLMDFAQIPGFRPWVYEANARAVEFLRRRAHDLDVVVTHHLPARGSLHPLFEDSPLNRFYLCDLEDLIATARPTVWVHGHTHASCDYRIGPTRILCNPVGISRENVDFDERKVVVVQCRSEGSW